MPANLTPQYLRAEAAYRRAETPDEILRCLELMLREIPKHKGTDKLQADLKAKISRAKADVEAARQQERKGNAGQPRIARQGAGRAVLIGGPNAGKSQLLASLTRATPQIAPYPFTTREPQPGMMPWEDLMIQLIDTPPITAEVLDAGLLGMIREADVVVLLVDVGNDDGVDACLALLHRLAGTKTQLARTTHFDPQEKGLAYTQTLLAWNKIDLPGAADRIAMLREFHPFDFSEFRVSALTKEGLGELRTAIARSLPVVRVYTKLPTAKDPDLTRPFVLPVGSTLLDVAEMVHHDVALQFKNARVWRNGNSEATTEQAEYEVHDQDIVEIHTAK